MRGGSGVERSMQAGEFGDRDDAEIALEHAADRAKASRADGQAVFGNLIGDAMEEQDRQEAFAGPVRGDFYRGERRRSIYTRRTGGFWRDCLEYVIGCRGAGGGP